jgi:hypothetical protein
LHGNPHLEVYQRLLNASKYLVLVNFSVSVVVVPHKLFVSDVADDKSCLGSCIVHGNAARNFYLRKWVRDGWRGVGTSKAGGGEDMGDYCSERVVARDYFAVDASAGDDFEC